MFSLKISFFMAALGLCCCMWAQRLLTAVASVVAEHGF